MARPARRGPKAGSVVAQAAHTLRQRLIHGQYPPGALMPAERELARELGISRVSLSRALSQLTAEGLIVQRLGSGTWVQPDAARRLPPGSVAVVHPVFAGRPHTEPALIIQGVADTLSRRQYTYEMLPVASEGYTGPVEKAVKVRDIPGLTNRYGAFLFIEAPFSDPIRQLEEQRVPLVVANLEGDLEVSATWVDHAKIAHSAVEVLAALGHRRIGLVATVPQRAFYRKTLEGYRAAVHRFGLAEDENLIAFCPSSSSLEAYMAARRLLKGKRRPTAVVAGRDVHAEGVCRAAGELGLVIGRDLSVIGFDDVGWPQEVPFLTTFREPCYEMGAEAAEMLIARMAGGWRAPEQREIPAPLILRRSAGTPADSAADARGVSARLLVASESGAEVPAIAGRTAAS